MGRKVKLMLSPNDSACQRFDSPPGFVKRAENFPEVAALAEDFAGIQGLTWHGLTDLLFDGFRYLGISEGALHLLLQLCRKLHTQKWAEGDTIVWPANDTLANLCQVSARTIQSRLRELEVAGLIIREYTRINSRMTRRRTVRQPEGGIDLAPFGARIGEIRAAIDAGRQAAAIERDARYRRFDDDSAGLEVSCGDEISVAHKQSHLNHHPDTVRPAAKAPGKSDASRRIADGFTLEVPPKQRHSGTKDPNCSPGGEGSNSTAAKASSIAAEAAHAALVRAIEQSPTLSALPFLQELGARTINEILSLLRNAISTLFPARNSVMTWDWGMKRHGWRIGLCLIAALDDPTVRDQGRMFGYLATRVDPGQLDLGANFRRIEKGRASSDAAPSAATETVEFGPALDPTWRQIVNALEADLGAATVKAWIVPLTFRDIEGGYLRLMTAKRFYADRVRQEFEQPILRAARRAGFEVSHLHIEVSS
ncbi:MAG TPA: helix-turn-helix domain-containing protein [Terriglobia bacterium]|nr:helix-turn-helix domain-containing protein [Terriglobia bacterium]